MASLSYFYERPGMRVRFELRSGSGEVLYASSRVRRRRGFYNHDLPLTTLQEAAGRTEVIHAVALDEEGHIVGEDRIASHAVRTLDAQAMALLDALSAAIANYHTACEARAEDILIVN